MQRLRDAAGHSPERDADRPAYRVPPGRHWRTRLDRVRCRPNGLPRAAGLADRHRLVRFHQLVLRRAGHDQDEVDIAVVGDSMRGVGWHENEITLLDRLDVIETRPAEKAT